MGNELNTNIVTTSDGKQYEKSGTTKAIIGSTAALGSVFVFNKFSNKVQENVAKSLLDNILKMNEYNTKNNYKLSNSLMKMYNESGLKEKGVVLFDYQYGWTTEAYHDLYGQPKIKQKKPKYNFKTLEEFEAWVQKNPKKFAKMQDEMTKEIEKAPKRMLGQTKKSLLKRFIDGFNEAAYNNKLSILNQTLFGANAFAKNKNVHINMVGTSAYALPHELGHAKNSMSKGLGKLTNFTSTKMAYANRFLLPLIIGTAILRDKKADGDESDTVVGKSLDFVKDNCVTLTAATQIPCLAEEGLATLKGWKMAKKYVSPEEFKMIKTGYKKAYMTYLASAATITGIVAVANTVKNWISGPKEVIA